MVVSSKVDPKATQINVQAAKKNNALEKENCFVTNYKTLIYAEAAIGVNRLYLLKCGKYTMRVYYLYVTFLLVLAVYAMIIGDVSDGSFTMHRITATVEFMLIVIVSLTKKKTFTDFFKKLAVFDDMLNITKEISKSVPVYSNLFWLIFSIVYSVCEYLTYYYTFGKNFRNINTVMMYIALLIHDAEQLFFYNMIQAITLRLKILKAHIERQFTSEKGVSNEKTEDKIETLSNNKYFDTSGMHRAYELLHTCAEQLTSVMSFPMIVMLFSSGLNTTILMKKFFQVTQLENRTQVNFPLVSNNYYAEEYLFLFFLKENNLNAENDVTLVYTSARCIKYTTLVIISCYYASLTSKQVTVIRSVLHNAVNTFKLDKIERRKIKAFFQLTQDSEFSYALWGVIRLSMSLPLSYASLCTTYLVIFIQFSKFID